jgi:hypothetical protein
MHLQEIPRPDKLNGRAEQDVALIRHPGVDRIDQHGDLGSAQDFGRVFLPVAITALSSTQRSGGRKHV